MSIFHVRDIALLPRYMALGRNVEMEGPKVLVIVTTVFPPSQN
jgi:hypothetical protein